MLRLTALLLLVVTTTTVLLAGCNGVGEAETSNGAGTTTPPPPPSNSASLAWDAVTAPNLGGYRVYFGTAPGTYLQSLGQGISVGNVTAYTLTGLASGTQYYFAVTAFDTLGVESAYSNEVSKNIP